MTTAAASAASAARPTVPRAFGRYELRDLLARSRRTMLWLGWDPRVKQEVLLSLPRLAQPDDASAEAWLGEARRVARLPHPHLAPVIDCGVHERWPYMACDRGAARTLAEVLAGAPAPGHRDVVRWLMQALQGLAYAHDAGFVHHDLQIHQFLIDERGQLRVMALAVAAAEPLAAGGSGDLPGRGSKGMPMDPAALRAHRGAAERDVQSMGVIAHQLLAGGAALDEADVGRVIDRLVPGARGELLRLPWTTPLPISDALRTIVNRATHSQPRRRYLAARTMLRALEGWLAADAGDNGGPVALLLERIDTVGHLPAQPGLARTIARLTRMEKERTNELAEQVLQDFALAFELLRQVNSAQVRGSQVSGNGPVLTMRRAIAMLGLDGIRHAATALRAWPGPLNEGAAVELGALIQRARLAGHLAQQLRPAGYDAELVFLLAVLQNLGRLLLAYHFPDDAEQIAALMRSRPATADAPESAGMSEEAASQAVMGVEIEAFANAAARRWGLTDDVILMLRRLAPERPVRQPDSDADLLRATASAANEVVDAITQLPADAIAKAFEQIVRRYGRPLGVSVRGLGDALRDARQSLAGGPAAAGDEAGPAASHDAVAAGRGSVRPVAASTPSGGV